MFGIKAKGKASINKKSSAKSTGIMLGVDKGLDACVSKRKMPFEFLMSTRKTTPVMNNIVITR